jgi:hypothetical protein
MKKKKKNQILEQRVGSIDEHGGHHFGEYTEKQMNDQCPYNLTKCGHPHQEYEFICFGRYKSCKYYRQKGL